MSERRVYYELPLIQGYALLAEAIESDPYFTGERTCPGYIAQEIEKRSNNKS